MTARRILVRPDRACSTRISVQSISGDTLAIRAVIACRIGFCSIRAAFTFSRSLRRLEGSGRTCHTMFAGIFSVAWIANTIMLQSASCSKRERICGTQGTKRGTLTSVRVSFTRQAILFGSAPTVRKELSCCANCAERCTRACRILSCSTFQAHGFCCYTS